MHEIRLGHRRDRGFLIVNVSDNADDLEIIRPVEADATAKRVPGGEVTTRHAVADQCDPSGIRGIGRSEIPAPTQRDLHGAEIAGRDGVEVSILNHVVRGRGAAFDDKAIVPRARQESAADGGRGCDTGQTFDPLEEFAQEPHRTGVASPVRIGRQAQTARQQVRRLESERDAPDAPEAAQEKPRRHEKHQRETDFGDHEHGAPPPSCREPASRPFQCFVELDARRLPGRQGAKQQRREASNRKREQHHRPIEAHLLDAGNEQGAGMKSCP